MPLYRPTLESLASRPLPTWFDDAKFGIFIHWGLYSVPGFAPRRRIQDLFRTDYDLAMTQAPYAEWYWNAIKEPSSPSARFHQEHYGSRTYESFRQEFEHSLEQWDPAAWARSFRDAGASYVVLTTKHHDGYLLWPSAVENPRKRDWASKRDIVGELATAVRAEGMRFGVYYSGGVDWSFNRRRARTLIDYIASTPRGDYPRYADAQVRDLVARYQPDILWGDVSWPESLEQTLKLFADYYEEVPDGVVNDRWANPNPRDFWRRFALGRYWADRKMKSIIAQRPDLFDGFITPEIPHSDFRTSEYRRFDQILNKKWESTAGIGGSFGYNRTEQDSDYATVEDLIFSLVDSVSKNGNLLLNVGPRGVDAAIPEEQLARLAGVGRWLKQWGEAVYGTRPWRLAEARTADGVDVRFTRKDGIVYAILLGQPSGSTISIPDLDLTDLPAGEHVTSVSVREGATVIKLDRSLDGSFANVIRFG